MSVARYGWFGMLCALTACRAPTPPPSEPIATVSVVDNLEIAPPAPIHPETNSVPAPILTGPAWPAHWNTNWISLESWGEWNGIGKPNRRVSNPHPYYEFSTTNGVISVPLGSRIARHDGVACWLGFAPQLIDGQPCVHAIDARKNLQPLLRFAKYSPTQSRGTIVIDPGHGGTDTGAPSVIGGSHEKFYTLDWALRLQGLLERAGWKVVLTRTRDQEVSLLGRVAVADQAQAAIFLSLHFNSAYPNRELAGLETYCLTPPGLPSHTLRTTEDDSRLVFPNNTFDEDNLGLALRLHQKLVLKTGSADRGVRRARFMGVLRYQNRPSVLIEGGYLSNPAEARRIATPEHRQSLAEAVAAALE